jgi:hypothetical protein
LVIGAVVSGDDEVRAFSRDDRRCLRGDRKP